MNSVMRMAVLCVALIVFCGCGGDKEAGSEESAPRGARVSSLYDGLVFGLTFEGQIENVGSGGLVHLVDRATVVDNGRYGKGCRLENGATISLADLPITRSGSWCLWMRPASRSGAEVRAMDANAYTIGLKADGVYVLFHDGKMRRVKADPAPPQQWTHVAMTWGDGSLKLYVNGEIHGQHAIGEGPGFPKRRLFIGTRWTGRTMAFTGDIDDVCIYNRAISESEVRTLVDRGLVAAPGALPPPGQDSVVAAVTPAGPVEPEPVEETPVQEIVVPETIPPVADEPEEEAGVDVPAESVPDDVPVEVPAGKGARSAVVE